VARIAALYAVKAEIRHRAAGERQRVRQEKSRPLVKAFQSWLQEQLGRISGKSKLAEATRYALARWQSLTRFLDDGRIELDTNAVERAISFAGSDGGARSWAIVASLIQSAKLNDVERLAYLRDVLERPVAGDPVNRLDELLPWNYAASAATSSH
jgi:transposase